MLDHSPHHGVSLVKRSLVSHTWVSTSHQDVRFVSRDQNQRSSRLLYSWSKLGSSSQASGLCGRSDFRGGRPVLKGSSSWPVLHQTPYTGLLPWLIWKVRRPSVTGEEDGYTSLIHRLHKVESRSGDLWIAWFRSLWVMNPGKNLG